MNEVIGDFESVLREGGPWAWLIAISLAALLTSVVRLVLGGLRKRLLLYDVAEEKKWDEFATVLVDHTKIWVVFLWIFAPLARLVMQAEQTPKWIPAALLICTLTQLGIWGHQLIREWKIGFIKKKAMEDQSSVAAIGLMYALVQSTFVILLILIGLSNLGVNIAALLGGLGIGGIAVALAAQNVLGDLLASLSIVLDKPFVVGDIIAVGGQRGTVENIGIKTTRVRSENGEELVFSNKDLLESRVQNYKRMWSRRVSLPFGVTYSTPYEKLEQIPIWVRDSIQGLEKTRFERCHLRAYGASSLDFELILWVDDPLIAVSLAIQEKVLLRIFKTFQQQGVEFAFPTQTLFVEKVSEAARST